MPSIAVNIDVTFPLTFKERRLQRIRNAASRFILFIQTDAVYNNVYLTGLEIFVLDGRISDDTFYFLYFIFIKNAYKTFLEQE